jgi:acetylornithine deacetylase/succinyl-diaminopimelate desuccinylase-like protein
LIDLLGLDRTVGLTRSAIPAVATATLNIRTVPDQKVADVADQLRR